MPPGMPPRRPLYRPLGLYLGQGGKVGRPSLWDAHRGPHGASLGGAGEQPLLGHRFRAGLVVQFYADLVSGLRQVEADCLGERLAQLIHVAAGSENSRQLRNLGPIPGTPGRARGECGRYRLPHSS